MVLLCFFSFCLTYYEITCLQMYPFSGCILSTCLYFLSPPLWVSGLLESGVPGWGRGDSLDVAPVQSSATHIGTNNPIAHRVYSKEPLRVSLMRGLWEVVGVPGDKMISSTVRFLVDPMQLALNWHTILQTYVGVLRQTSHSVLDTLCSFSMIHSLTCSTLEDNNHNWPKELDEWRSRH